MQRCTKLALSQSAQVLRELIMVIFGFVDNKVECCIGVIELEVGVSRRLGA